MIRTERLTKYFYPQRKMWNMVSTRKSRLRSRITAVEDVDLRVEQGELFGLLGPNGAGKTTLIKMLSTLVLPSSGTAFVNDYGIHQELDVKASIGLVTGEERSFYWRLSGRENLRFFAALQNISARELSDRLYTIGEAVGLGDFIDRRFDSYSSGMKQRLAIARGLLHNPKILCLDEPTKGLDPIAAHALRETIRRLTHKEGHTVVLVTHQLHEAEEICDRIAIMHKGRIRVVGSIQDIRKEVRPERLYVFALSHLPQELATALGGIRGVISLWREQRPSGAVTLHLKVHDNEKCLPDIIRALIRRGIEIRDMKSEDVSLEEVFAKHVAN